MVSESPAKWVMEIPAWRPHLLNELMNAHHMERARMKRKDADMVIKACLVYRVPKATAKRRVGLVIRGAFRRMPDEDSPLKSFLDALVTAGAIVDDSAAWVEWDRPRFERGKKATIITLEDIG